MPRFSIVVPVHNVQGYLRTCLESVLGQSYGDFELIVVDDRSPDGSPAIIDEFAARDERVVAVHLPVNGGIGPARNHGAKLARGEYLLFLDSDDSYTPGTLRAIAERIDATGRPDIVLFDYARTHWYGAVKRNRDAEMFAAPGPEVFTVAERPELLDLFTVVWNKAYRLDFFREGGFTFPTGFYEDAVIVYQTLWTARTITLVDRICVYYRQRRQGNAMRTPSREHFEVFAQYERLFRFLGERPELERWRGFLYDHMADHYLFILRQADRVPPSSRPEFHRRAARDLRAYRPDGHRPGAQIPRTSFTLLARAPYALYALHRVAAVKRAGLRRRRLAWRRRLRRVLLALHRRLVLRRPLDRNLAVYSAFSHRGVLGDPAAIHRKAQELAPHIRSVWVVGKDHVAALPPGVDHVLPGSRAYRRVTARAGYLINNVNWANDLVKRRGSVHIHTHQGTPVKSMGADLLKYPGARRGFSVPKMLRRADRWDYSLVANPHSELVWDRAYPCGYTSLRSGSPRNDCLVRPEEGRRASVRQRLGVPDGSTLLLYAPTKRDHRQGGYAPARDLERLIAGLPGDHVLAVRLHPSLAQHHERGLGLRDLAARGLLLDVTDEPHVEDLLLASDALITDYSALMFDYAHLDRPIVLHAYDLDTYLAARGTYFDVTEHPPGHVTRDEDELARLFASGAWRDEESTRLRTAFRSRFGGYDDGRAAERVVRTLMLGEDLAAPMVPAPAAGAPSDALTRS
ncbi:bifunctional glycosyltransferase family 2 protein/CDP-glycerol:glycerophosphate glycerophosphotransferase [Streptomyces sp. BH-SS-21]|uniref:Bifunctional glycosyltransferase family 2 protein/CDP-glycerol:glycerophosphate glycerophosphotransferase n=1 Tax=Streptomyces liliiviolaceus TaxID=2823109 RepID=A0A940XSB6_9ACTN|nr:bifunctional glycosyltransferase family 2 protein/CDP-glycerol:glycerophosphate glycerophosphotransferase [Streptomyces liliiviolaceus]MBQ0848648.1 bifunctional glycosyltransferase family 2 protein/CDP-glycerol:glycerophosphate glycerophosphotransferase [Streptomyces liliiviolaceus]